MLGKARGTVGLHNTQKHQAYTIYILVHTQIHLAAIHTDMHNSRNSLGQYIQSKLYGWWWQTLFGLATLQLIPDLNAKMPWYKLGCARVRSLLGLQKESWQRVCCYKGLWELHPFFSLTLPLSLQEFQGIVWAIVKGLGMEGSSCQYLKIAVGGNVVVDDLFSRETEVMSEHPSSVQRGCPISSCWINGQKSNDRFQLQPLID